MVCWNFRTNEPNILWPVEKPRHVVWAKETLKNTAHSILICFHKHIWDLKEKEYYLFDCIALSKFNQSVLWLLDVLEVLNMRAKEHQISFIATLSFQNIILISCISMINCLTWHSYPYFCLKWNKLVNGIKIYIQGISMV